MEIELLGSCGMILGSEKGRPNGAEVSDPQRILRSERDENSSLGRSFGNLTSLHGSEYPAAKTWGWEIIVVEPFR